MSKRQGTMKIKRKHNRKRSLKRKMIDLRRLKTKNNEIIYICNSIKPPFFLRIMS